MTLILIKTYIKRHCTHCTLTNRTSVISRDRYNMCNLYLPLETYYTLLHLNNLLSTFLERKLLYNPLRQRVCMYVCMSVRMSVCLYVCNILTPLPFLPFLPSPPTKRQRNKETKRQKNTKNYKKF